MISNSLGAMPRGVAASSPSTRRLGDPRRARLGGALVDDGLEVGNAIGRIIGAPAGSVSMHENVTTAHMVALSCLPRAGSPAVIVCSAGDFPSMIYLLRAQQALGFELTIVPARSGLHRRRRQRSSTRSTRRRRSSRSRTSLPQLLHLDPRPIIERAHAVGAQVVLDTYQSAGIIPVDVAALGVDFATGGCLKWLCGGPGNAFLYTRPDLLRTVRPRLTGWFSHTEPFAFGLDAFEPHADAMRMMNGTPSIPAWYAALPGLRHHRAGRHRAVRARSQAMTARAARAGRSARLPHDRHARSRAAGWHGRRGCPRRAAGVPHPESPRLRRRLPARRRHPRVAALLQHGGRGRSR